MRNYRETPWKLLWHFNAFHLLNMEMSYIYIYMCVSECRCDMMYVTHRKIGVHFVPKGGWNWQPLVRYRNWRAISEFQFEGSARKASTKNPKGFTWFHLFHISLYKDTIRYHYKNTITGWWFQPLWKIWKSNGIIVPNIWKVIKFMLQTTSQIIYHQKFLILQGWRILTDPDPSLSWRHNWESQTT